MSTKIDNVFSVQQLNNERETEMKKSLNNGSKERELWPGRYYVFAIVKKFEDIGNIYKNVLFTIFQNEMPEDEAISLLKPFGFTPDDEYWMYEKSYAEETFSAEQANELIPFLEGYRDTKAYLKPASKPSPKHGEILSGVGCLAVGGGSEFYMFSNTPGYSLSIKVWGYYDLRQCKYVTDREQWLLKKNGN
jgi:hypothetical protein